MPGSCFCCFSVPTTWPPLAHEAFDAADSTQSSLTSNPTFDNIVRCYIPFLKVNGAQINHVNYWTFLINMYVSDHWDHWGQMSNKLTWPDHSRCRWSDLTMQKQRCCTIFKLLVVLMELHPVHPNVGPKMGPNVDLNVGPKMSLTGLLRAQGACCLQARIHILSPPVQFKQLNKTQNAYPAFGDSVQFGFFFSFTLKCIESN